ncbi:hypothetical protein [Streptomyces sp. XY152]|uniref:hypothetical protein n=1 Tax=Streptomyces sp. XY152 TaxID=1415560 RepID=UPI000A694332|nr:hypothetical protein [Streptomyces sp. XY152]
MTRGGRRAVLCAVAVLVLTGCGQPAAWSPYARAEQVPEELGGGRYDHQGG